ncbi:MAG: ABC transporter ATP-binding protein [Lachnospiraceae bacterium]|jgi:ABC-type bacteriocin/lantibiotic exporter with double-glycine peptidase domain|nr:ABC transporter ATP-binding protein [Lachnospiraceae bacterium]
MIMISQTKKSAFLYLTEFKIATIGLLIIIGVGVCINSFSPIIYGKIVDLMIAKQHSKFLKILILYAVMLLLMAILSNMENYFIQLLSSNAYRKNQQKLFEEVLRKKVSDLEKIELGKLMSNLSGDLSVIIQYSIELVTTLIFILFNLFVPLVFIFCINIKMALISIIFAPVSIIIFTYFKNRKQKIHKELIDFEDKQGSFTVNCILNINAIKAYKIESEMSRKYNLNTNSLKKIEKKSNRLNTQVEFLNELTSSIFQIILLVVAGILIIKGEITIGIFISFGIYAAKLFSSIDMIQKLQLKEQPVVVSLERLQHLNNILTENYERSSKNKVIERIENIDINNLSFSYEAKEEVLSSLTILINQKGFYSLVGKNGSGKSTLFKILMNFYEDYQGSICLNGINYFELNTCDIRKHITYVQKVPFIIEDSLYENISLYKGISDCDILKICERVGLCPLVKELPNGLSNKVSEKTLSSGQLQKLSFARALAHPADVYLFDEITSDLDGFSEGQLVDIMKTLGKDKIVISISHRINAVSSSDKIFFLKSGKIVAEGSFTQLQNSCEEFSKMFSML